MAPLTYRSRRFSTSTLCLWKEVPVVRRVTARTSLVPVIFQECRTVSPLVSSSGYPSHSLARSSNLVTACAITRTLITSL